MLFSSSVYVDLIVSCFLKETESISSPTTNFCDVKLDSSNCTSDTHPCNSLGKVENCCVWGKHNMN